MKNMKDLLNTLVSGTCKEISEDIRIFSEKYGSKLIFEELDQDNLRTKMYEILFNHLTSSAYSSIRDRCLAALRILSRDKTELDELITNQRLDVILQYADLGPDQNVSVNTKVEALKLLYNLLFNSSKIQTTISQTSCLQRLVKHISKYGNDSPYEIKLFNIRILFLITALNVPTRSIVKDELHGDIHLTEILRNISASSQQKEERMLHDDDTVLACEILKVLFNLYIQADDSAVEEREKYKSLVSILYELFLCGSATKQEQLQSNIINLLTVIPFTSYSPIIRPVQGDNCQAVYQNMDVTAISILIKFLDQRLDLETNLLENTSPVITALIRLAKAERLIRKYVRLQVLPPLQDVMKRPEEGTTLRAKLCKLLTCPLTELRDLVAEFLFVLCKENVSRMVKYTGYGNAAGMFANKGLLGRHQQECYSSESEDSETEEYVKYKEQINPVTGCYEHPKPNPTEGMSEEQKEYEALQLVGLMDKLTREGIVQPCRIGEDGKPKPIQHVLELQSELPRQQIDRNESNSD